MATIAEMIREVNDEGYFDENAEAKVCQDIVLKALSESSLNRNATIKGGVVMRSMMVLIIKNCYNILKLSSIGV